MYCTSIVCMVGWYGGIAMKQKTFYNRDRAFRVQGYYFVSGLGRDKTTVRQITFDIN